MPPIGIPSTLLSSQVRAAFLQTMAAITVHQFDDSALWLSSHRADRALAVELATLERFASFAVARQPPEPAKGGAYDGARAGEGDGLRRPPPLHTVKMEFALCSLTDERVGALSTQVATSITP